MSTQHVDKSKVKKLRELFFKQNYELFQLNLNHANAKTSILKKQDIEREMLKTQQRRELEKLMCSFEKEHCEYTDSVHYTLHDFIDSDTPVTHEDLFGLIELKRKGGIGFLVYISNLAYLEMQHTSALLKLETTHSDETRRCETEYYTKLSNLARMQQDEMSEFMSGN